MNAFTLALALGLTSFAAAPAGAQEASGNPEAAKVRNPVASTPESVAAGAAVYEKRCRVCHGADATGGFAGASNLIDSDWTYGSTDGEIYSAIMQGIPPSFRMEAWEDRLSETDGWNVVNFLRSLAKK